MKQLSPRRRFWTGAIWIAAVVALLGCAHATQAPQGLDETQVLVAFFENERNYIHDSPPFVIGAQNLRVNLLTKARQQYLIDIRAPADFGRGHIQGAVHVPFADVYDHVKGLDAASFENIVVIDCDGQAAAYVVSLLRAAGYPNAVSLKWGMSGWAMAFADGAWLKKLSNVRADAFVTKPSPPKNPPGPMPRIATGGTTAEAILEARLRQLFAEGYAPAVVTHDFVFARLDQNTDMYVINYWPPELYAKQGHIPGAVNYPPAEKPFLSTTHLATLSTTGPNILYCFTGQTSSYVAGYLRILGYDARSLAFGANSMIYDQMHAGKVPNTFVPETEIKNYDYVGGR
ncbi:rhodanese-like domain-containing protein [Desulfatitalea alkaliphila]|uniref:Rhodanese domain-containing protein n=1 Tax=Desulfatitalea alkaliphila TaxID=2929485 RepID=A0AA41R334_9BACT|nr:rhodanese-like domain-containing protein [Desulfatitalea alkaliphila]MCJ8502024.1 hypothetical protein [Desulfatitalea alkaliphila]